VCERTGADKKGGHLCRRKSDGKLMLRESAMCPDGDKKAFEDITTHKFFNTNNLWVNLPKLQAAMLVRILHPSLTHGLVALCPIFE
jgi:UDP-N-acetylglucosamine pyrophosphorylase